jgi:hypothetical protein
MASLGLSRWIEEIAASIDCSRSIILRRTALLRFAELLMRKAEKMKGEHV